MIWRDRYSVGVDLIDRQHRELFRRVTEFVETLRSDAPWEKREQKVTETLDFMQEYVVSHFAAEEAYQREIGYPGYEAHRQIHEDMVRYVTEVAEEYRRDGYDERLIQQFAGKLLAWLIHHVAAEDRKIADFAHGKEAGAHE